MRWPFSIFFRLLTPDGQEQQGDWVRVGNNDGEADGWIESKNIFDWDTRFALKPNAPQGDAVFRIMAVAPKQFTADFQGSAGGSGKEVIAPILEKPSNGANPEYTVAFFAARAQTGVGRVETDTRRLRELSLEIVYVIDTTTSMTPLIKGTKEVAKRSADALGGMPEIRDAVKFGLVQYRDSTPRLGFVADAVSELTDIDTFRRSLEPLAVTRWGSEETKEDVLAGLLKAIDESGWSENSSKHIVLLGDASAHIRDCNTANPSAGCGHVKSDGTCAKNTTGFDIPRLIAKAQRRHGPEVEQQLASINFHSVRAKNAEDPEDEHECVAQFVKLSENAGRFQGYFANFDPNNEQDKQKVVDDLNKKLSFGFDNLGRARSGDMLGVDPEQEGEFAQAIWRIYLAIEGEPISPVELGKAFIRSEGGDLLAQQAVFVNEDDLLRLHSTLFLIYDGLKGQTDPADRGDVSAVVGKLKEALTTAFVGQEIEIDSDTQLKKLITSLPLKTDALEVTAKDIATKKKEEFVLWLGALKSARQTANDLLMEKAEWFAPSAKAANTKCAFVLLDEMP